MGIEIVTPAGVERRVEALDSVWSRLAGLSDLPRVAAEYRAWRKWRAELGWTDKLFATGTLAELDTWESRYREAKALAEKRSPSIAEALPSVVDTPPEEREERGFPWLPVAGGVIATAVAAWFVFRK